MKISPNETPSNQGDHFQAAMELLFESAKEGLEEDDFWEDSIEVHDLVERVQCILKEERSIDGHSDSSTSNTAATVVETDGNAGNPAPHFATGAVGVSMLKRLHDCYNIRNQKNQASDRDEEFKRIENFISEEQTSSRDRRSAVHRLEAPEEKRLASEVAHLRRLRLKTQRSGAEDDLRWKISDAERAYFNRKMVSAKASQRAGSDVRFQFARVRVFLEKLLATRQHTLHLEYRRELNYHAIVRALKKSEARVVALDHQIAVRLYRKKKTDLIESHMTQTLLEAEFLESMMNMVDTVQHSKETAARELFDLHVGHLKTEQQNNNRRQDELELFTVSGTLEMAKLAGAYTAEDFRDQENGVKVDEHVCTMERRKDLEFSPGDTTSLSKLYGVALWSLTSNDLGLSSTGSLYSSTGYNSFEGCRGDLNCDPASATPVAITDDNAEEEDDEDREQKCLTPVGRMHMQRLARELVVREKSLEKRHDEEIQSERRSYQKEVGLLRAKHQSVIDNQLKTISIERDRIRETIDERMEQLANSQAESTKQLQNRDQDLMRQMLLEEDERIKAAESSGFVKAQELISTQVFHEVRNALSSVIALSEMTDTLKNDSSLTPGELIHAVNSMHDQIGDVVDYALEMLNDIMDVSKINSGAFVPKKEDFDLTDIVTRATRMQQAKAVGIELSFQPSSQPCIAFSDAAIVQRIVATLISNSVKFTKSGAVQAFIWPLEELEEGGSRGETGSAEKETSFGGSRGSAGGMTSTESMSACANSLPSKRQCGSLQIANKNMKFVAVGVADTGHGLSEEMLESTKYAISCSASDVKSHGAQNTGFGLYHAHAQTRALASHLRVSALDSCTSLLNEDMLVAMSKSQSEGSNGHVTPGKGTVLYFPLPVYEDSDGAKEALQSKNETNLLAVQSQSKTEYVFRPLPASQGTYFRILVADDVMMLRKGMVHTISKLWRNHFPDCPVSVSTACTAEDALRAAQQEAFDLIVCDHYFVHDASKLKRINPDDAGASKRPRLRCVSSDTSLETSRNDLRTFFEEERFTMEEEDGSLLGLDALLQIAGSSLDTFSVPILMLVSGHKIALEPGHGIIVVQKPLKLTEFISILDMHSLGLVEAGRLRIQRNQVGSTDNQAQCVLVNSIGGQLFVRSDEVTE